MLLKLLTSMDKERFSNQVVSLTGIGPIGKKLLAQGIPVSQLGMPNGKVNILELAKLWRLLRYHEPAILQTWLYHADLMGLISGKLAGIKNIYWNIRCSYVDLEKYHPITKWTIKLCSLLSCFPKIVITNSIEAKKFHVGLGYKVKHWEVIPNGFDLNRFKLDNHAKSTLLAELHSSDNTRAKNRKNKANIKNQNGIFLIGMVARYDPMKDHTTFIKAACHLLQKRLDVHFILVGKGVEWKNTNLVRQIPGFLQEHFHLLGERNDIENITSALDIASSTSYGEGFSNSIGEAMASRVPCVVTDVGDSSYIVGETGLVVSPRNPDAVAKAWEKILNMDEEERLDLGRAARNRILSHFSIERVAKQYEHLYTKML